MSRHRINVVILCGGFGTRLRPVISDHPKVLAKIGDKTFLDILIGELREQRFRNIILCVGYLKNKIKGQFQQNYDIIFSEEEEPLGTGGALKNAKPLIESDTFMVMNGDSICKIDFNDFYNFHVSKKAILSMVLTRTKVAQDFASVVLDGSQRIMSFKEKEIVVKTEKSLINAGMYLMQKEIFSLMPEENRFSLEYDLFPKLTENKRYGCYGFITDSELIDIGTPERYEKAINILTQL